MSFHYKLFEFKLFSELYCPELLPLDFQPDETELSIRFGKVSTEGLIKPRRKALGFQAKKDEFWMNVPNIARYLVTKGREIVIDPVHGADEASIRVFLLGSCLGALLMQRDFFILHGNALKIGSCAISMMGLSGAGKSTLSASFVKRGYSVLADDVCALNTKGEVLPSFPQIKLWADAAKQLAIETTMLRKIRPQIEKYAVPLEANFYPHPLPLKLVYILNSHNKDAIEMKNIVGFEKYQLLHFQSYRLPYVKGLEQEQGHKTHCSRLAGRVALAKITRPSAGNSLEKLTDFIESDLSHRGLLRG